MSARNTLENKRIRKKVRELRKASVKGPDCKQIWVKVKDMVKDGYNRYIASTYYYPKV